MKRFSLLLLLVIIAVPSLFAAQNRIAVASFGAVPDDGQNDANALRRAAAYCRSHKGTTLVFEPGVYDFRDETAVDIERKAIDGTYGNGVEVQNYLFQPRKPYVTGLDFTGCKDLTILADGAVLKVEGWMQVLSFIRTQNVMLRGLTITYKRPAATEAKVVAADNSSFDVEFDPTLYKYIDKVVQGRIYFFSQQKQRFYYGGVDNMELVHPGLIRMKSTLNPPVGDYCIIRYGGHYRPCIMLKESKDVTVKDVSILSFPGMGVVGHLTENIMLDGLKVVPEPGRISSTNTDATHFTSCSGTLTLQNCVFKGNGDDCTNVHNYYYCFYPQESSPRNVEIRIEGADLHAQSLDYPMIGDTMIVVGRKNLNEQDMYVVEKVDTSATKWKVLVTLNKPFVQSDPQNYYMINHTRFPKVRILHNTVCYNNGRAFLLKVPHVVVAGNTITNSTLTAIKLGSEVSWHEGGPVEDALIENNYISHCGEEGGKSTASCVMVTTEAEETPPYVNRNIIIRNNIFDSRQAHAVLLYDAKNVEIKNNIIDKTDYVRQEHCSNVHIVPDGH